MNNKHVHVHYYYFVFKVRKTKKEKIRNEPAAKKMNLCIAMCTVRTRYIRHTEQAPSAIPWEWAVRGGIATNK